MSSPREVTAAALRRRLPLPPLERSADKEARGRVLVAGGSAQNPGALRLAGEAALRAGAGKLRLAAPAEVAPHLAVAVPEARVFALAAAGAGGLDAGAAAEIAAQAERVDALLLGPGLIDEAEAARLVRGVLQPLRAPAVALDAGALAALREAPSALAGLAGRAVITPHAGEAAGLLEMERDAVEADAAAAARAAAERFGAVVALKGAQTLIAAPDGALWRYGGGGVGLGTSGSGDVLAGLVAGLLARGAAPLAAACWAVWLHGEAGNALVRRHGDVGFLARELAPEVPRLLRRAQGRGR